MASCSSFSNLGANNLPFALNNSNNEKKKKSVHELTSNTNFNLSRESNRLSSSNASSTTTAAAAAYNSLLRAVAQQSDSNPLKIYEEMLETGARPDRLTFPYLIGALVNSKNKNLNSIGCVELVHDHVVKMGYTCDGYVVNNLIRFYLVARGVGSARKVFDRFPERDVVSWTTIISGYVKMGLPEEAISQFHKMVEEGLKPDSVTVAAVLSACSEIGDSEFGHELRRYVEIHNLDIDSHLRNAFIRMFAKCGEIESAYKIFRQMPSKNLLTWNSMISGLAHKGRFKESLSLFRRMQKEGVRPDGVTLVSVLHSCANLGALELGEWVHTYMNRRSIKPDGVIGNALIDMYGKCGRIDRAFTVFNLMESRDVFTYTSVIVGHAMNSEGAKALNLFSEMLKFGIKPNGVTFVGVISACGHSCLVEEGLRYFEDMSRIFNVSPQIEHYGCVVDMLARAGRLSEAEEFIAKMPMEPDASIWGSLLAAYKVHGENNHGENFAKRLLELEHDKDGSYVLLSNIYASHGRRSDSMEVRKAMSKGKVRKTPGCSLIEIDGVVHEFKVGEKLHKRRSVS